MAPGPVENRLHDAAGSAATMWHAGASPGGILGGTTGAPPPVASQAIEFDLGANFDLTGAHVWNMNQAFNTGRGIRGVEILISPDATGPTWTSVGIREFTQGTGVPGLAAQAVSFTGTNARRVRFEIQSAWSGQAIEYVGLSEVRFRGSKAPTTISGTNLGPIPDNDPAGRDVLFTVAGATGLVETVSVQLAFNPAHTRLDHLRIQLFSPSGASAWLFRTIYVLPAVVAGPYTFTDSASTAFIPAANALPSGATVPAGSYRAGEELQTGTPVISLNLAFAGTAANGTWTLRFTDARAGDTGTVSQASLFLTTTAKPGKPRFTIQPNGSKVFALTQADPNASYMLMGSSNLITWTNLQTITTDWRGEGTYPDASDRGPRYFYRTHPVPPAAP